MNSKSCYKYMCIYIDTCVHTYLVSFLLPSQLQPDMTHKHELTVTFLRKGKYHLEIKSYTQISGAPVTQVPTPNLMLASSPIVGPKGAMGIVSPTTAQPPITSQESPKSNSSSSKSGSEPASPKARPQSPQKSQPAHRNVTSPDSTNKALQMAKMYEARVAFRDKTVYKTNVKKASASEQAKPTSETDPEQATQGKESSTNSSSITPDTTEHVTCEHQKTPRVGVENLSNLVSKFSQKDSVLGLTNVCPVRMSSGTPSPPPLPRGYHGRLTADNINRTSIILPEDCLPRFKKLLKIQSDNSSSVRAITGPQFTFSVS